MLAAPPAQAATLSVSSAQGNPGDKVQICVDLATGGRDVAGVQGDLVWNPQCAEIDASSCRKGDVEKTLHKSLRSNSRLRAIVLSLDNTSPIRDGARLFCCDFFIPTDVTSTTCPITLQNTGASDPSGNAISAGPYAGAIVISGVASSEPAARRPEVRQPAGIEAPAPAAPAASEQAQKAAPEAAPVVGGGGPSAPVVVAPEAPEAPPAAPAPAGEMAEVAPAETPAARAEAAARPPEKPTVEAEEMPAATAVPEAAEAPEAAATEAAPTPQPTEVIAGPTAAQPEAKKTQPRAKLATPTERTEGSACQISGGRGTSGAALLLLAGGLGLALLRKRGA